MPSAAAVHTFVVGARRQDDGGVLLSITASAGYRAGLAPSDPVLRRAAAFCARPSTPPAVYVTGGRDEPMRWTRFDDVVALPAEDGSAVLQFRNSGDGQLPQAFLDAAMSTQRVLTVDIGPGAGWLTVVLFT